MSSATSIKRTRGVPLDVKRPQPARTEEQNGDAGFRPWHLFVLASLVAATAAVMLSRRSTPEHLVFISLAIGGAGIAAAALYRTLAPLVTPDIESLSEPLSNRARGVLERDKALVLRSLKELEFDKAMGKVSDRDFDEMSARLRGRAVSLLKQLDEGASGYRVVIERELQARMAGRNAAPAVSAPTEARVVEDPEAQAVDDPGRLDLDEEPAADVVEGACPQCQTVNDEDAAFCKRCGRKL
jgi:hypothetical protein